MLKFFAEKMWVATHIFSAKNIRILCIESAKTVNEMTLNELVKLTTLWTTGPSSSSLYAWYTNVNCAILDGTLRFNHVTFTYESSRDKLMIAVDTYKNYQRSGQSRDQFWGGLMLRSRAKWGWGGKGTPLWLKISFSWGILDKFW